MAQVEADLGTKLDWVAVNHPNTGHPHVHVIVNGRDALGEDLFINGDYPAGGIRERANGRRWNLVSSPRSSRAESSWRRSTRTGSPVSTGR